MHAWKTVHIIHMVLYIYICRLRAWKTVHIIHIILYT